MAINPPLCPIGLNYRYEPVFLAANWDLPATATLTPAQIEMQWSFADINAQYSIEDMWVQHTTYLDRDGGNIDGGSSGSFRGSVKIGDLTVGVNRSSFSGWRLRVQGYDIGLGTVKSYAVNDWESADWRESLTVTNLVRIGAANKSTTPWTYPVEVTLSAVNNAASRSQVLVGTYSIPITLSTPGFSKLRFWGENRATAFDTPIGRMTECYIVSTSAASSCTGEIVAGFSNSPSAGLGTTEFQFTDTSEAARGITSWLWTFPDGTTSTEQNPVKTLEPGQNSVQLQVTGEGGTDTSTQTVNVYGSNFTASTETGKAPLEVKFTETVFLP